MTARQIRRAAERRANKLARKPGHLTTALAEVEPKSEPLTSTSESQPLHSPEGTCQPADDQGRDELTGTAPRKNRSTGPTTPEGKAIACLNNLQHGLTGTFRVLASESQDDFDRLCRCLEEEHQPAGPTEHILVTKMAEHLWLSRRAQRLQDVALTNEDEKRMSLYMRYATTNDRGFHKCLNDLLKLRRERNQAAREFESQTAQEARVRLANARAAHLELDTEIRATIEAPIPGYTPLPFETIKDAIKTGIRQLARKENASTASAHCCR